MVLTLMTTTMPPPTDPTAEDKVMTGTTPAKYVDESSQGPKRAIAIAHPLRN
jgi:hypothetical protein